MVVEGNTPNEVRGRWHSQIVLKADAFGMIERGSFLTDKGEVAAVLRRVDGVPWWMFVIARHFLAREAYALAATEGLNIAPPLLYRGRCLLVRGWIDAVPLHIAKPAGERAYFRSAQAALRRLHRAGIVHNDLAKEQNWLRTPEGRAMVIDFQLAMRFSRRNRIFRIAAYEDLRHLLKHKQRYAPEALTAAERRILSRKSWPTRIWMATGKRIYIAATRRLLNYADREGGGHRLFHDAPTISARLKAHPEVRDVAIVTFPDRRKGTGIYAFVESETATEAALIDYLAASPGRARPPEHLQVVTKLPCDAAGKVRTEILQLVAMNQIDLIDSLVGSQSERNILGHILARRKNLRDRFSV